MNILEANRCGLCAVRRRPQCLRFDGTVQTRRTHDDRFPSIVRLTLVVCLTHRHFLPSLCSLIRRINQIVHSANSTLSRSAAAASLNKRVPISAHAHARQDATTHPRERANSCRRRRASGVGGALCKQKLHGNSFDVINAQAFLEAFLWC